MGKRKSSRRADNRVPAAEPTPGFNNPFAALAGLRKDLKAAEMSPPANRTEVVAPTKAEVSDLGTVVVQSERKGRAGKTVTRLKNLPPSRLAEMKRRMRADLGCGATDDAGDLLLLGDLVARAAAWLEREGARRVVVSGRPSPRQPVARTPLAAASQHPATGSKPGGTNRSEISPGLVVEVVQKADQSTGALTRGVVSQILTRSNTHPHGIKVRLTDGRVGRVKRIVEGPV